MSKKQIIDKFARHENDTGSSEVQIALLTDRISNLTDHLKKNKKDNHSRLGLFKMISLRRRLLKYLQRTNADSYANVISSLGIRPVQVRG